MSDETATLPHDEIAAPPGETPVPEPQPYAPPEDDSPEDIKGDEEIASEDADDDVPGPREEDIEEILEPKINPVTRVLSDSRGQSREYFQGPFLYFQQIEMYGLLGRATKIVLEGENGIGMNEVFDMLQPKDMLEKIMAKMPGAEDAPKTEEDDETDMAQAAKMLAAFARVIESSPDILKDFFIIVLDIPKAHRPWAYDHSLPRISREDGNDIMHTFIDQNWGVLEGFFTEELPKLFKRAAKARERHKSAGDRSKR